MKITKSIATKIQQLIFILISCFYFNVNAQQKAWKFAHISDTHIGDSVSIIDLQRTVNDINNNKEIDFAIVSGDITEFGADSELKNAKSILDQLNKPWYVVPGNHDAKWSESGGNSFKKIFGSETFAFKSHGILFLGTNCGPNMRMSPGQVPRENIVWLDSVLKVTPKETPIIFANHYPLTNSLNNWYEVIDRLKTRNIQMVLCGHGHTNKTYDFEGIPGVMGRSNLRAKDSIGAYNIVSVVGDSVFYNERIPNLKTKPIWTKVKLQQHDFSKDTLFKRPSYAVNEQYKNIKVLWQIKDEWDIGAGGALSGKNIIVGNTGGWVKAYKAKNGKLAWQTKLGGKLYSTPNVSGKYILISCTDNFIYCLASETGKILWKKDTGKPIVGSIVSKNDKLFCGSADGHFRSFDIKTGETLWDYNQVEGFVETQPLLYQGNVYFGSWGNKFYALSQETGQLQWVWDDGYKNRMYSPAACVPVATQNKLYIVTPDRSMTCFDAKTGAIIWRKNNPKIRVRESMGLSKDSNLVYVKTMDGDVLGIDTKADSMKVAWKGNKNMGYDISPTVVQEHSGVVFALADSGTIYAYNRGSGNLEWMHKISNCLLNPLNFIRKNKLISTTMDGVISCLKF